ncbi:MAG: ABC transporter permease [Oscillospiraceae bacterium]|nr:ABC transporter permease [Oscillospiraceae bacterium]
MISLISGIKNDLLKYTAYRTYSMKTRLVMLFLCGGLGFPLLAFAASVQKNAYNANNYSSSTQIFLVISVFLAAIAAGVICLLVYTGGINCYEYYSRRESVDKIWTLPVTDKQRFWGDFISGIVPLAAVYIVSALLGLSIVSIGFYKDLKEEPYMFGILVSAAFIGLIFLLSLYIFSVFCAALCGRAFEAAVYPAIICGIIPAIISLLGYMVFSGVWQIEVYEQLVTVLRCSSPFGFGIGGADELNQAMWSGELSNHLIFTKPAIIIPFIIINAGFLTAAYYLGKKRRAESTGKAFVFKYASTILNTLVIFCITAAFCWIMAETNEFNSGAVFGLVTCTALAYLILDVSAKRGFKSMGKALGKYAAMLMGSVVISSILLNVNGFGIGEYIPPADKIKSVQMNHLGRYDTNSFYGWHAGDNTVFTDAETIELFREINKGSNERFKGSRGGFIYVDAYSDEFLDGSVFTYTLENGKTVKRNVRYGTEEVKKLLPLLVSEEYKKSNLAATDRTLEDGGVIADISVYNIKGDSLFISADVNLRRIYDAFKLDYMNETFEQKFLSEGKTYGTMRLDTAAMVKQSNNSYAPNYTQTINVHIREHYTNLLGELERQGIVFSGEEEELYKDLVLIKSDYIFSSGGNSNYHYSGDYYFRDWHDDRYIAASDNNISLFYNEETADLINLLMSVSQPAYLIDGPGYLIGTRWDGDMLVVPPKYEKQAAELMEIAQRQFNEEWAVEKDEWGNDYLVPKDDPEYTHINMVKMKNLTAS